MAADTIFLEGIKFHGFHGLTRLERQIGVRLSVDVALVCDLERSGRSDRMADTVDYARVYEKVIEVGRGPSHRLLESFALTLIDAMLEAFPVDRVTVRVRKETPVIDGILDGIGVEMSRDRTGPRKG